MVGCRHAQPKQCMHMRGLACGPPARGCPERPTRRRHRRALRVEQRNLRRWVQTARVRPFRRAIKHAGAWTGWRARRCEACGHTCAECAQGRRSWVQVRQTHPHPVALTPVGSFIAVESVVDDLEPAAQSGSRRAMMPYDCPPSHLPTRPCSTPRQRFGAFAKTTRKRRNLRQTATMHLKCLNEVSPENYQAREGIHGIACDGGKRDAGTRAPEALSGTPWRLAEPNDARCARPRAGCDTGP